MLRLRQAVVAVTDLDSSAEYLQSELGLGEPFADPDVAYFGLRNAVFAIGDTFLELVSPAGEGTAAGRLIERRGGDTGYMAMLQVDDVAEARQRASVLGIREVFNIEFEDIGEAHLHPADIGGAIVSISEPRPETSWRWGGPGWTDIELKALQRNARRHRGREQPCRRCRPMAGGRRRPDPGDFRRRPRRVGNRRHRAGSGWTHGHPRPRSSNPLITSRREFT